VEVAAPDAGLLVDALEEGHVAVLGHSLPVPIREEPLAVELGLRLLRPGAVAALAGLDDIAKPPVTILDCGDHLRRHVEAPTLGALAPPGLRRRNANGAEVSLVVSPPDSEEFVGPGAGVPEPLQERSLANVRETLQSLEGLLVHELRAPCHGL